MATPKHRRAAFRLGVVALLAGLLAAAAHADQLEGVTLVNGETLPDRPAVVSDEAAAVELTPPGPGERRVVEVPPGSTISLADPAFDPGAATYAVDGNNLVVNLANGGVLVLVGFFDPGEAPSRLSVLDGPTVAADELLATAEMLPGLEDEVDVAAGPAAGGEVFGAVSLVRWLLARLDVPGSAQAATFDDAEAGDRPVLAQVMAQLEIATGLERLRLIDTYRDRLEGLLDEARQLENAGRGDILDVRQAEIALLQAEIEHRDVRLALDLAVDAHEDRYGERLSNAVWPVWESAPPADLAEILAKVTPDQAAEARRMWRQMTHAGETLPLFDKVVELATRLRDGQAQRFEIGQIELGGLLSTEADHYLASSRRVERRHDRLVAEAWLLAATGGLHEGYVLSFRRP